MKLPYSQSQTLSYTISRYPRLTKKRIILTYIFNALTAAFFCVTAPAVTATTLHVERVLPDSGEVIEQSKAIKQVKIKNDTLSTTQRTTTVTLSNSQNQTQISMGGTIDGVNSYTRRSKIDPVSGEYYYFDQIFQPMELLRITNTGVDPIINPILKINNWGMVRSIRELSQEITVTANNWEEKTKLLWEFLRNYRYANYPVIGDVGRRPLQLINSTGGGYCGTWAAVLEGMVDSIGGNSRTIGLNGHVVTEIFYQNEYHLFDPHYEYFFPDHNNSRVVSVQQALTDRTLLNRTYGSPSRGGYFNAADLVEYDLEPENILILDNYYKPGQNYNFTLLPSASLQFYGDTQRIRRTRTLATSKYFDSSLVGMVNTPLGKATKIELTVPSFLLGADLHLTVPEGTSVNWAISLDGEQWIHQEETPAGTHIITLDEWIDRDSEPELYRFFIKIQEENIQGDIRSYFQVARQVLPKLHLGDNTITLEADSPFEVTVQCDWQESSFTQPPANIMTATFPKNGATVLPIPESVSWPTPTDPDGDSIVDYELMISEDPHCRWPLAPQFNPLLSLTPSKGMNQFDFDASFLNESTDYYWKVRAKEANGIWSGWSPVFTFSTGEITKSFPWNLFIPAISHDYQGI
ncbi:MAG: transglutaminase domain-containing protein [Desulfocapsa sp.]|nr:transglutaminase domain-containing protein [Desulfocapsa sp.]